MKRVGVVGVLIQNSVDFVHSVDERPTEFVLVDFYKRKEVLRPVLYNLDKTRALTERRPCDGSGHHRSGTANTAKPTGMGHQIKNLVKEAALWLPLEVSGSRVRPRTVLIVSVPEAGIRPVKLRCSSPALVYPVRSALLVRRRHSHGSSTPILPKGAIRSIMDPFSLSTGIVGLIAVALKLVVGALGMIDKTVAAYDEAADELKGLQQDLEYLQTRMIHIHGVLKVLASNTKDRGFKKLLQE